MYQRIWRKINTDSKKQESQEKVNISIYNIYISHKQILKSYLQDLIL